MLSQIQAPRELSGALLGGTRRDQPLPWYHLAAPALAAAFGAFKQEGARGNYTHTQSPGPGLG